jgi:hypothetical protein
MRLVYEPVGRCPECGYNFLVHLPVEVDPLGGHLLGGYLAGQCEADTEEGGAQD